MGRKWFVPEPIIGKLWEKEVAVMAGYLVC
jgi:hypothetical protein